MLQATNKLASADVTVSVFDLNWSTDCASASRSSTSQANGLQARTEP